jgi:hypothetical protein
MAVCVDDKTNGSLLGLPGKHNNGKVRKGCTTTSNKPTLEIVHSTKESVQRQHNGHDSLVSPQESNAEKYQIADSRD